MMNAVEEMSTARRASFCASASGGWEGFEESFGIVKGIERVIPGLSPFMVVPRARELGDCSSSVCVGSPLASVG